MPSRPWRGFRFFPATTLAKEPINQAAAAALKSAGLAPRPWRRHAPSGLCTSPQPGVRAGGTTPAGGHGSGGERGHTRFRRSRPSRRGHSTTQGALRRARAASWGWQAAPTGTAAERCRGRAVGRPVPGSPGPVASVQRGVSHHTDSLIPGSLSRFWLKCGSPAMTRCEVPCWWTGHSIRPWVMVMAEALQAANISPHTEWCKSMNLTSVVIRVFGGTVLYRGLELRVRS